LLESGVVRMSALSRFLPDDLPVETPVALVAGRGDYPHLTAARARDAGRDLRLVALDGETRDDLFAQFPPEHRRRVKVGQVGHLKRALRDLGAGAAVLIGQVRPGRLFGGLHPDLRALQLLATLRERNAATIFGTIVREIESVGCRVLDARAFLDADLADEGVMTGGRRQCDGDHLAHGVRIATEVARLRIGQGVLVRKGTVLAVEAFEGTDAMLRRGGEFKTDRKIFVKVPEPDHDYRFDVPVFGPTTLETMVEAGIGTAALAIGRTVLLDKAAVLARARQVGIEILGVRESQR
jgi:DUF1009 family protein